MKSKILLWTDRPGRPNAMADALLAEGLDVRVTSDAKDARDGAAAWPADVILADLEIAAKESVDRALSLRAVSPRPYVPIVVLGRSAGRPAEKIAALDSGADEFIDEPHDPHEVAATLRALARRLPPREAPASLRLGRVELDARDHRVRLGGREVALTAKEFDLLRALVEAGGHVLTREELLSRVWRYAAPHSVTSRTLDVHVRRLRKKLQPEASRIVTVRSVGYRIDP